MTRGGASVDSLFIALLPLPTGSASLFRLPIAGLLVPITQGLALIGIGHFGAYHIPSRVLVTDAVMHYVTAVAVSLVVPMWAGRKA